MPSSTTKLFIQNDKSPKHMQNRSLDSSRMLVRPKRSTLTVPYHADTGSCGRYAHKSGRRGTECALSYIKSNITGVLVIQNRVTESEKGYKIDLILTVIETIYDPDRPTGHQCSLLK